MIKTKNFNIQVPELGDVPDITQVSNAIQDLEDALAGTLEIMDASIQGSRLTLKSVSRQTKRTKYYDGMSIRFLCPQTITANTLKTVVVDDLLQQVITVPFDIVAGEYVDITYRGTSFTAHPVVIQKSENIDSNSNETVATSKAIKKVNDKVNELKRKAPTREHREVEEFTLKQLMDEKFYGTIRFNREREGFPCSSNYGNVFVANGGGDTSMFFYSPTYNNNTLYYRSASTLNIDNSQDNWCQFWTTDNFNPDTKEPVFEKKSGFNKEKTDDYNGNDTNKLLTQRGANSLHTNLKNNIDINTNNIDRCLKYDIKNDNIKYPINIAMYENAKYQLGANIEGHKWGWYSEYGTIRATGLMGETHPLGGSEYLNYAWYIANNLEYDLSSKTFKRMRTNTLAHILITGDHEKGMSLYRADGAETNLMKNAVRSFHIDSVNLEGFIGEQKIITSGNINKTFCPYQIGDILTTTNSKNPNTTWTGTSWERIANGKTLVGVDEGQSEFNTVMKQGGEKTHTLTINEIPSHNHGYTGAGWGDTTSAGGESERGGFDRQKTSGNTGGGQAHNNLQPYLTVYYWRRIG